VRPGLVTSWAIRQLLVQRCLVDTSWVRCPADRTRRSQCLPVMATVVVAQRLTPWGGTASSACRQPFPAITPTAPTYWLVQVHAACLSSFHFYWNFQASSDCIIKCATTRNGSLAARVIWKLEHSLSDVLKLFRPPEEEQELREGRWINWGAGERNLPNTTSSFNHCSIIDTSFS
jgi:hypothetical protein